ncbi:MAG: two-component regulator propeller domain-containing protein [Bacteroidales bacterium]
MEAQIPFLRQHELIKGRTDYRVEVVFQDSSGWIWFGTELGLFKFDGNNLIQYTVEDSLLDNNITAIAEDHDKRLWIGHRNGKITTFYKGNFTPFLPPEGIGNVEISDIVTDHEGIVWYATLGEGIYRFDGRYLSNIGTEEGLPDNYVYDIELDFRGRLWLGTDYGIAQVTTDSVFSISMKDGLPDNIVHVVESDKDDNIWIGTHDWGVAVYNTKYKSISSISDWSFGTITGMDFHTGNELWVSTLRNGIVKLNTDADRNVKLITQITEDEGLISNSLNAVFRDAEHNIWAGGRLGVVQILPPVFEFLNSETGTPFSMAYSLAIDNVNDNWVCGELDLFRGRKDDYGKYQWTNISTRNGLSDKNFISVYVSESGAIWAGTYDDGVFRFSESGALVQSYTTDDGLPDNNVIHISGDQGTIFFSTLGGGVAQINVDENRIVPVPDPVLENTYIYSTARDQNGRIWIAGSFNKPAYIEDQKVHFIPIDSFNIPQFYGVTVGPDGSVWYNTGAQGVLQVKEDTVILHDNMGSETDNILAIEFDSWGNLLIISNYEILLYKPGEGPVFRFGENMGLAYHYPVLNSVYKDDNGNIWIGTEKGIIKYNPEFLGKMMGQPCIYLSVLNLFGLPINKDRNSFRFNENNFTFGYTGFWFKDPESIEYRYMLRGYDLEWNYSKRNQPFTYSKLPPGTYTFIAQVSIDGVNWHDTPVSSYSFTIELPFWKKWWFIIMVCLLATTGIYMYIKLRLSKLESARQALEIEVKKRTEKIRYQNTELEKQKEEIETQRDHAREQRDQIEQQNEEIQASIRYAHRIQSAALPPRDLMNNLLGSYFVLNKPRGIVSGDFYWVAGRKDHVFFAVGDCTGHGVPGAFMSMLGLSALNDIVKSLDIYKSSQMLDLLNERISESLHKLPETVMVANDGMDISLCIYEPATRTLQFSAAQNPLYIIRNNELIKTPADKAGIGTGHEHKQKFTNHVLPLEKGDLLYLFSDGFPDQFGGPNGKKYMYGRFREFLVNIHREPLERQKWLLDEEIENWHIGLPQIDDILIMGLRI